MNGKNYFCPCDSTQQQWFSIFFKSLNSFQCHHRERFIILNNENPQIRKVHFLYIMLKSFFFPLLYYDKTSLFPAKNDIKKFLIFDSRREILILTVFRRRKFIENNTKECTGWSRLTKSQKSANNIQLLCRPKKNKRYLTILFHNYSDVFQHFFDDIIYVLLWSKKCVSLTILIIIRNIILFWFDEVWLINFLVLF